MYFVNTPKIIQWGFKDLSWKIDGKDKIIYLTFDDGPEIETTPLVLDILNNYNAKATFFCIGQKAYDHPELVLSIRNKGHSIGNHSYNHINGIIVHSKKYTEDVIKAKELLKTNLFRPPYGKITPTQLRKLKKDNKLILWSVMPGDFDKNVSKEKLLERSIKYTKSGTIIVFHDIQASKEKLLYALPKYLNYYITKGFKFNPITSDLFL